MRVTPRQAGWIGFLGGLLVRMLGRTWRFRSCGHPWVVGEPNLYAFLHGQMLVAGFLHRDQGGVTMINDHRDGEIMAQVVQRLGYVTARGSTTRGGVKAFLQMVSGPENRPWGMTPDGPRGLRGKVHEGVIQLAAESGRPIWPLGYAISRRKELPPMRWGPMRVRSSSTGRSMRRMERRPRCIPRIGSLLRAIPQATLTSTSWMTQATCIFLWT